MRISIKMPDVYEPYYPAKGKKKKKTPTEKKLIRAVKRAEHDNYKEL